jgi:hypothetical protein
MSTKGDEYYSGTSLDVAEQYSSNPSATGPLLGTAAGSNQSKVTDLALDKGSAGGSGSDQASSGVNKSRSTGHSVI